MRILGVSFNNFNRKNVSFGRFLDENARKVTKEVLYDDKNSSEFTKTMHSHELKKIDECKYVDVYTDKNDGKVKVKWDKEYLSQFPMGNGKNADESYEAQKIEDVRYLRAALDIASNIWFLDKIIGGATLDEIYPKNTNYDYGLIDCAKRNAEEMPYW